MARRSLPARSWSAALVAVVLAGAAGAHAQPARPDWKGTGVVLALLPPPSDLHRTRPVVIIEHEPIPGLMTERMSMPFLAASTALFQGLHAGDRVSFSLRETSDALLVVSLERLPAAR